MSTRRWVLLGDIPVLIALILDTELENLSDQLPADDHHDLNTQDNPNANDKEIEDKGNDEDEDEDADLSQVQTSKSMSKISSQMYLAKTPTG